MEAKEPVSLERITKLWELLRLALDDFHVVSQLPHIHIAMSVWHAPLENGECMVCLAGAVMRQTLDVSDDVRRSCASFELPISRRLAAINDLRCGDIEEAYRRLNRPAMLPDGIQEHVRVAEYETDPSQWLADMESLFAYLKSVNI